MFLRSVSLLVVGVMATASLLSVTPVSAATQITNQDIANQEMVVRDHATDTLDAYLRLVFYTVIQRLQNNAA